MSPIIRMCTRCCCISFNCKSTWCLNCRTGNTTRSRFIPYRTWLSDTSSRTCRSTRWSLTCISVSVECNGYVFFENCIKCDISIHWNCRQSFCSSWVCIPSYESETWLVCCIWSKCKRSSADYIYRSRSRCSSVSCSIKRHSGSRYTCISIYTRYISIFTAPFCVQISSYITSFTQWSIYSSQIITIPSFKNWMRSVRCWKFFNIFYSIHSSWYIFYTRTCYNHSSCSSIRIDGHIRLIEEIVIFETTHRFTEYTEIIIYINPRTVCLKSMWNHSIISSNYTRIKRRWWP